MENGNGYRRKILIVDDEKDLVSLASEVLVENGYDVLSAYNGQEGLEKAWRSKPDLMILDLMLPGMDGYRVCGLLKKDTRYSGMPIIICSARAHERDALLEEELGADAYLSKPFKFESLLEKITELISKK